MPARGPTLDDVVALALARRARLVPQEYPGIFGAAGRRGDVADKELMAHVSTEAAKHAPVVRLMNTDVGAYSAKAIGNDRRTLVALERITLEIVAASLRVSKQASDRDRLIVMSSEPARPPVLMQLSADLKQSDASLISYDVDLPLPLLEKGLYEVQVSNEATAEAIALAHIRNGGKKALAEAFLVSRPEIVRARRPRMIPISVPRPPVPIEYGEGFSSVGVLCRDSDGELGVTGALHGTGMVGTEVLISGKRCRVKRANVVQDIAFIPVGPDFKLSQRVGLGGVEQDREPSRSDEVRFEGVTNQKPTRISGADDGLLRKRPNVQLKLQTAPDTDKGDSGCALFDTRTDRILGFAFEQTASGEFPAFTDWIWAANALRALGLTLTERD